MMPRIASLRRSRLLLSLNVFPLLCHRSIKALEFMASLSGSSHLLGETYLELKILGFEPWKHSLQCSGQDHCKYDGDARLQEKIPPI